MSAHVTERQRSSPGWDSTGLENPLIARVLLLFFGSRENNHLNGVVDQLRNEFDRMKTGLEEELMGQKRELIRISMELMDRNIRIERTEQLLRDSENKRVSFTLVCFFRVGQSEAKSCRQAIPTSWKRRKTNFDGC